MASKPGTPIAVQVDTAERRTKAVKLRLAGKTWQAISDELGYAGAPAAHTDVTRALDAARKELALVTEQHRELELQRLDDLEAKVRAVLDGAHITVQHGRVVKDDDGVPLADHDPLMRAADRLLKIAERRAKLLGLDQPIKHEVSGQVLYAVEGVNPELLT